MDCVRHRITAGASSPKSEVTANSRNSTDPESPRSQQPRGWRARIGLRTVTSRLARVDPTTSVQLPKHSKPVRPNLPVKPMTARSGPGSISCSVSISNEWLSNCQLVMVALTAALLLKSSPAKRTLASNLPRRGKVTMHMPVFTFTFSANDSTDTTSLDSGTLSLDCESWKRALEWAFTVAGNRTCSHLMLPSVQLAKTFVWHGNISVSALRTTQ